MSYKSEEHKQKCRERARAYYYAHREQCIEKVRNYASNNKEKVIYRRKSYYLKNKEKVLIQQKSYASNRKDERKVYIDKWNEQNKEKNREYKRSYKVKYPEKVAAAEARRRASKRTNVVRLSHEQWVEIQNVFNHCCAYCGKRAKGHLTQDHVVPLSKGGAHDISNVVPACRSCNTRKLDRKPLKPVQTLLLTLALPYRTALVSTISDSHHEST